MLLHDALKILQNKVENFYYVAVGTRGIGSWLLPSPHQHPIKPRWLVNTGRIKEQIRAGWQVSQRKQIDPVGVRQIGAVLHHEIIAQHAIQSQHRITCPKLQCQHRRDNRRQQRIGTRHAARRIGYHHGIISSVVCANGLNRVSGIRGVQNVDTVKTPLIT
jgi:hypothetical protein